MADNHVNISIGSSFNGEGFNKLANAAAGVTKTTGQIMNGVGQIGNAIGGLDNTLGKVTGAIGNMLGALAVGGPVGLAIAGVTALVGWIGKIKKEAEEAKNKLDEMAKAAQQARFEKEFKAAEDAVKNANKALDDHQKALDEAAKAAERLAKAEKNVADAQERLSNAQGSLDMANLQSQIQQRVQDIKNPEQRSIEQAKGNVELQQLKNQQALDAANKEVESAREQLNNATNSLKNLEQTKTDVQNEVWRIEAALEIAIDDQKTMLERLKREEQAATDNFNNLATTVGLYDKETVDAKEQMNKARSKRETFEERIQKSEQDASDNLVKAKKKLEEVNLQIKEKSDAEKAATIDLETANTKLEKVRVDAEAAEREVKNHLDELVTATDKEAKARNDAAFAERLAQQKKREADEKIQLAEEEAAKALKNIDNDIAGLRRAIADAETAMQHVANGVNWANNNNWGGWGNQDFNPDNFGDFQRANRFGDRADRDAQSRKMGPNRLKEYEKRAADLQKRLGFDPENGLAQGAWDSMSDKEFEEMLKNDRNLSNADKRWLKDWRKWNNVNDKGNKEKQVERLQQQRQRILQDLKNDVAAIKDDLKDSLRVK